MTTEPKPRTGTETVFRVGPETLPPLRWRPCPVCHRTQWIERVHQMECSYCGYFREL